MQLNNLFTAKVANIHKHLATHVTSKTHKNVFFHTQISAQYSVLADIESSGMGISVGKEKELCQCILSLVQTVQEHSEPISII